MKKILKVKPLSLGLLAVILLAGIIFSLIQIVRASYPTPPDPGHHYGEIVGLRDLQFYLRYGTGAPEVWYTAPNTGTALTTGAPSANYLRAIPFITSRSITLDRIAINVTTAATGYTRLGIYADGGNVYPGNLVIDAGQVDTGATGVKSLTINVTLNPGLYWLVAVSNAAPTIRAFAVGSLIPVLGYGSALGTAASFGYSVSYTYSTLPATFPSGASLITATPIPAIFVRLSSVD